MDLEMCRAQILSNDYRDFIVSMDGGRISLRRFLRRCVHRRLGQDMRLYI